MRFALKNAILRAGYTQRSIAHRRGIRESRLSEIIRGWVDPTPEERQAIAGELGLGERGLFRNVDPESPHENAELRDAVA